MRNGPIQVPLQKPIPPNVFLGVQKNHGGIEAELVVDRGRIRLLLEGGFMLDVVLASADVAPGRGVVVRNENGFVFIPGKNADGEGGRITNDDLRIPARWSPARIATGKMGSARWATRAIVHVVLQEELRDGTLFREAGDYLCDIVPAGATERTRDDVTCPKCLKRAGRYIGGTEEARRTAGSE